MEIDPEKTYAVLTGDIVGSSRLERAGRLDLHATMQRTAQQIQRNFGQWVPLPVDHFRGDSWQLFLRAPRLALRLSLFYRAYLRGVMGSKEIDSRVAIGIGRVDFLPEPQVSSGDGPAFRLSGEALEEMPRTRRLALSAGETIPADTAEALEVVLQLIDVIAQDWTDKQALAVSGGLLGRTQEEIAASWRPKEISQQAVAQHLKRAGWHALQGGLDYFETTLRS